MSGTRLMLRNLALTLLPPYARLDAAYRHALRAR